MQDTASDDWRAPEIIFVQSGTRIILDQSFTQGPTKELTDVGENTTGLSTRSTSHNPIQYSRNLYLAESPQGMCSYPGQDILVHASVNRLAAILTVNQMLGMPASESFGHADRLRDSLQLRWRRPSCDRRLLEVRWNASLAAAKAVEKGG